MPHAGHPFKPHQGSPVLKAHCIPLKHIELTGRTIPILVRAISIEKSVLETILFGGPSF